jgi:hypothetical protein
VLSINPNTGELTTNTGHWQHEAQGGDVYDGGTVPEDIYDEEGNILSHKGDSIIGITGADHWEFVADKVQGGGALELSDFARKAWDWITSIDISFFLGTKQSVTGCIPTPIPAVAACATISGQIDLLTDNILNPSKICVSGELNITGGGYGAGTVTMGWGAMPNLNNWKNPVKLSEVFQGFPNLLTDLKNGPGRGFKVPLRHGAVTLPEKDVTGHVSIEASAGFRSWTYGVRGMINFPGNDFTVDTGMGIGQGVGVGIQGGVKFTKCINMK